MDLYIAFLSDGGVRFPPGNLRDPLIAAMQEELKNLRFPDFGCLGIYMHLPGASNTFGMKPGVTLELNQKENQLDARCVLDFENYKQLGGSNWNTKLNAIVDGVISTIDTVLKQYEQEDEFPLYEALLEGVKLPVE